MHFGRTSYLPNPNLNCILQNRIHADFACNDIYLRLLRQARKTRRAEGECRCSYRTSESFFSMSGARCGAARADAQGRQCPGRSGLPRPRECPGAAPGPAPVQNGWSQGASCPGRTMAPLGDGWGTKALLSGMILYAYMWPLPEMALWKVSLSWSSAFKCRTLGCLLNLSFPAPRFLFCATDASGGHVQITRWCWAFHHHFIELFSNGQDYFLHSAKSFTRICYLECFFCC